MRKVLPLVLVCLILFPFTALADDGWENLFDGKTMGRWKPNEHPESWTIRDGALTGHGERSHLYYMGGEVKDFELKTDVMINRGGNSGIYFHIAYHEDGWFFDGHEVQINNTHVDPVKTGSLWNVVRLFESPVEDDEWFTMHITVKGRDITVKINGKTLLHYTEPEGAKGPRHVGKGFLALQQHDPGSTVRFRNLKLKRLDPVPNNTAK